MDLSEFRVYAVWGARRLHPNRLKAELWRDGSLSVRHLGTSDGRKRASGPRSGNADIPTA